MSMEFVTRLLTATDSEALIELQRVDGPLPQDLTGSLSGPTCDFARTLPSQHALMRECASDAVESRAKILITEPCYWSPALPFLYQLKLQWRDSTGQVREREQIVGFRRLAARRESIYRDSRRVVLRGIAVDALRAAMAAEAREAEVALMAPIASVEQCEIADRWGIVLIADLRDSPVDIPFLRRLVSRPSVAAIVFGRRQQLPPDLASVGQQSILAFALTSDEVRDVSLASLPSWHRAIIIELQPGARPPGSTAAWGLPVIAIRRGAAYADFREARAACDRLQAELAPEFNLAGYFVSSA